MNKLRQGNTPSMNDFLKIKELGSGHYGSVFLAREKKTGTIFAIKQLSKSALKEEDIVEQFIRELKIQLYLNHPNIMKMYGYFHDEKNFYIIMEAGMDRHLKDLLKKVKILPEIKVVSLMRQLCNAVQALHSQNIIHRDIKP